MKGDVSEKKAGSTSMAGPVLGFNEQFERILQVGVVMLIGGMLSPRDLPAEALWFVPLLVLVIRPVAVGLGLIGAGISSTQFRLMAWFGIRGIGSIYYLIYAIGHGLPTALARQLSALTLTVVAASIVVHGISVTPLMSRYQKQADAQAEPG